MKYENLDYDNMDPDVFKPGRYIVEPFWEDGIHYYGVSVITRDTEKVNITIEYFLDWNSEPISPDSKEWNSMQKKEDEYGTGNPVHTFRKTIYINDARDLELESPSLVCAGIYDQTLVEPSASYYEPEKETNTNEKVFNLSRNLAGAGSDEYLKQHEANQRKAQQLLNKAHDDFKSNSSRIRRELNTKKVQYENLFKRATSDTERKAITTMINENEKAISLLNQLEKADWGDTTQINGILDDYKYLSTDQGDLRSTINQIKKTPSASPFKAVKQLGRVEKCIGFIAKMIKGLGKTIFKVLDWASTIKSLWNAGECFWDGRYEEGKKHLEEALISAMWNAAGIIAAAIVALTECIVCVIIFIVLLAVIDFIISDDEASKYFEEWRESWVRMEERRLEIDIKAGRHIGSDTHMGW